MCFYNFENLAQLHIGYCPIVLPIGLVSNATGLGRRRPEYSKARYLIYLLNPGSLVAAALGTLSLGT